ncbi:MAG: FdtA/QdtA family cupin domain-containing protein [Pontixanthobacter sp.]
MSIAAQGRKTIGDKWHTIELPTIEDPRGDLSFVEGSKHIPFDIARVYYAYNMPVDAVRGGHAHIQLEQAIFALSGSFRLVVDDGSQSKVFWLRNPRQGIYLGAMSWRDMDSFSQGAVYMTLASQPYEEDDYIRDRATFERMAAAK